jgi:hypothetical protein
MDNFQVSKERSDNDLTESSLEPLDFRFSHSGAVSGSEGIRDGSRKSFYRIYMYNR